MYLTFLNLYIILRKYFEFKKLLILFHFNLLLNYLLLLLKQLHGIYHLLKKNNLLYFGSRT